MDTKKIFFLLLVVLLFWGCISKECRDVEDVTLELLVDYSPIQDTFNVGDTLHIVSNFPDLIKDIKSDEYLKVDSFSFFTTIDISIIRNGERIVTDIENEQIVDINVNHQLFHFSSSPSTGIIIDNHEYKDEKYNFNLGLVVKKEGLYGIACRSDLGRSINTDFQKFEGQCPNQELGAQYKLNSEDAYNYNFDLIEGQPPYENVSQELFVKGASYVFFVKE